jgi:hypothetical protein
MNRHIPTPESESDLQLLEEADVDVRHAFVKISSVFALVLIIFANFLGDMFNGSIRSLLRSQPVKHAVVLFTLYFFVVIVDSSYTKIPIWKQLPFMAALYATFVLFTRTEGRFALASLAVLCVLYSIHNWFNVAYVRNATLTPETLERLHRIEMVMGVLFTVFLLTGFLIYTGFMAHKYGVKMNLLKMLNKTSEKVEDIPIAQFGTFFAKGLKTVFGM